MRKFWIWGSCILGVTLVGYMLWPLLQPHLFYLKSWLIAFKGFCRANPITSYMIFSVLLSSILMLGLPLATLLMLMAGVTYNFWEATTLITVCRIMVALGMFVLARHLIDAPPTRKRRFNKKPALLQRFEHHPAMGLFLMRLAPLPDGVVNFSMGGVSIRVSQYLVVSLIGMIPITIACVWLGRELGSVTQLINFLS